jgi:hypothetical protein
MRSLTEMRVYCHVHRTAFETAKSTPVVCEVGHLLGAAPNDESGTDTWEYCCSCRSFWLVSPDGPGVTECPVCNDRIAARFFCHRCRSLILEPTSPMNGRDFFLSLQGTPLPACPGCGQIHQAPVVEHQCQSYAASFITARTSCPFCRRSVYSPPAFPIAVSGYLNECPSAGIEVVFEPVSKRFIRAPSGPFLIFPDGLRSSEIETLLPNLSNFDSDSHFSTLYRDYFICDAPGSGQVIIDYPATVKRDGQVWLFNGRGRLHVEAAKMNGNEGLAQHEIGVVVDATDLCPTCGARTKPNHKYCKKCGAQLALATNANVGSGTNSELAE